MGPRLKYTDEQLQELTTISQIRDEDERNRARDKFLKRYNLPFGTIYNKISTLRRGVRSKKDVQVFQEPVAVEQNLGVETFKFDLKETDIVITGGILYVNSTK